MTDVKRRVKIYDKIMDQVVKDTKTGCWIWQGSTSGKHEPGKTGRGYGRISIDGATMSVHRVMFTHAFGIIPHKKQIDHTCRNRLCCNPDHLELVTHKQNCKRRDKRCKM
jgi:hypothetical protein